VGETMSSGTGACGAAIAYVLFVADTPVTVRLDGGELVVDVADDGTGGAGVRRPGHGLLGMRERVALHGGTVEAGPRDGGGFRVRARIPIPASVMAGSPPRRVPMLRCEAMPTIAPATRPRPVTTPRRRPARAALNRACRRVTWKGP